jgi:hypothetical protein
MGHYYSEMMCEKCGELLCKCKSKKQKKFTSKIDESKFIPLELSKTKKKKKVYPKIHKKKGCIIK